MYDLSLKILVINLDHMFVFKCHDISVMTYKLEKIAIRNVKGVEVKHPLK